jgi:hypothetical protein
VCAFRKDEVEQKIIKEKQEMDHFLREQRVLREKFSRLDERSNELRRHAKQLQDDHILLVERRKKILNYMKASEEEGENLKKELVDSTKKRKELR